MTAKRHEEKLNSSWEFAFEKAAPVQAFVQKQLCPASTDEDGYREELKYQLVELPHDWAVNRPFNREMVQGEAQGFRDRWGIGWYRKSFVLEKIEADKQYTISFGGVFENCTIWVNHKLAGTHKYGYSSFRIDITELVKSGENLLMVKVDNTIAPADRWYSGCGIYRSVTLQITEKLHLEPWEIIVKTSLKNGKAIVSVDTGISSDQGTVKGCLISPDGTDVVEAESQGGCLRFSVEAAKCWSAEEPNRYDMVLNLMKEEQITDTLSMKIGIREVVFDVEKGMLVNGEPVKLKGVCVHQEAGCLGTAVTMDIWRDRLLELKKLGCNAIRTAHHTFAEEFLDLCDELGFYVYEEPFDKWKGGLYGRYFDDNWKSDIEAMVKRDRNHPSIVIWGVGNEVENQGQASMLSILKMLTEYTKSLDSTRPVTYAMNPHFKREAQVDLTKIKDIQQFVDEVSDTEIYDARERVERIAGIAEIVDIISCNYQEQWYELIHERNPKKLILGSEVYEYFHGHYDQMQNFTEKIPSIVPFEVPYCIGSFIWTGYDYLGESMGYPAKGWSGALIRTNNEWRPIAYMLQSIWSEKPMVHVSVMDYSLEDEGVKEHWDCPMYADHWHFPQFHKTVIPYMITTNCEEAALFLNGKQFYLAKPSAYKNGVITGFVPWQPGTLEAVGYQNGKEICRHVLKTPKYACRLEFDQEILAVSQEREHVLLTVRAVDEDGVFCFREAACVRFIVEGEGTLKAVDSGKICSHEPYGEDTVHLYHGSASVMIKLTGRTGCVRVSAYAGGMHKGEAVIEIG